MPVSPGQSGAGASGRYVSTRKERQGERRPAVMQPPLTPMIDVVFQLLLFFLLACQFRQAEGQIPANLPDVKSQPRVSITTPIRITLRTAGPDNMGVLMEIADVDIALASAEELYAYLMQMKARYKSADVPVIIKPVGGVRWGHVVNAFNQAVRARFKNIGLAASDS